MKKINFNSLSLSVVFVFLTIVLLVFDFSNIFVSAATPTDSITVNAAKILKSNVANTVGVNMNYLLDDDKNGRLSNAVSTTNALKNMGTKYMRYPGGEKADSYLWSIPPYTSPKPTLARTGNCEWPANDTRLVQSDNKSYAIDPLDFDEFITMAKAAGAEPIIVVAYDSMFKASTCGQPVPTKQQLLDNATSWVKYANVTKKYNVKYWEIGNETYLQSYNGWTDAQTYANDLITFSTAMKAVDSTIKIGANGSADAWWQTVIQTAGAKIDFLSVHNYPNWQWSYEYYRTNNVSLINEITTATNAINYYSKTSAIKNKLRVNVTEVNAADWSTDGWPNVNDLGHALVLFDIIGQQIKNAKVDSSIVWNTRWVDTNTNPTEIWDVLNTQNGYNATGKALFALGNYIQDQLVNSTSTSMTRTYSFYSSTTKKLTVFLINKDTVARNAKVTLQNITTASGVKFVLKGTGNTDTNPTWSQVGTVAVNNGIVTLTQDPTSLTVLTFQGN